MDDSGLVPFVAARFNGHLRAFAGMIALILGLCVLEYVRPAERGHSFRGRLRNVGFMALFQLCGGVLVSLAAYFMVPHLLLPHDPVSERSWPALAGLILLYLALSDFVFYWYHRAQHASPSLWLLHELHHSDDELNATSSLRTYLLERPIQFLVISVPIATLVSRVPALRGIALDADAAGMLYVVSIVWLFVAHANIRLELGALSWMATGPQLHRIHHSIETRHQRKNFAQFFPIFDVAFGTYWAPARGEFPRTGVAGTNADPSLIGAIRRPFLHWFGARSTVRDEATQ